MQPDVRLHLRPRPGAAPLKALLKYLGRHLGWQCLASEEVPVIEKFPRLSQELTSPCQPDRCQGCGATAELGRWQEHDDRDKPEPVLVVLCRACAEKIEDHPRLYRRLGRHEPWPGCMAICLDCRHRQGTRCTHERAKANGGPGVLLAIAPPSMVHIDYRDKNSRRRGEWLQHWPKDATACRQKEPVRG